MGLLPGAYYFSPNPTLLDHGTVLGQQLILAQCHKGHNESENRCNNPHKPCTHRKCKNCKWINLVDYEVTHYLDGTEIQRENPFAAR